MKIYRLEMNDGSVRDIVARVEPRVIGDVVKVQYVNGDSETIQGVKFLFAGEAISGPASWDRSFGTPPRDHNYCAAEVRRAFQSVYGDDVAQWPPWADQAIYDLAARMAVPR
jgi:hypothetical protein